MKKSTKIKIFMSIGVGSLAVSIIPVSIIKIVESTNSSKPVDKKYEFMSKTFNSKSELREYANSLANITNDNINTPTSWTINVGNKMVTFNKPSEVINFLNKNIQTSSFTTNKKDFILNVDNSLNDNELKNLNFLNVKPIEIYRGKNNTIHLTEKSAKDSYLSIHNVYYFDNLFFRTKEELGVYLEKEFIKNDNKKQVNSFVLKNRDNEQSLPITFDDIKKIDDVNSKANKYISNFVDNNVQPYFKIHDPLGNIKYFNKENLNEISSIYKPNFVKLTSNKDKGNWIVDLDKSDEYDLYGPYYIQSDSSIELMKDPKNWNKVDGNDYKMIESSLNAEKINKFFHSIIPPTTDENNIGLFFKIDILQKNINEYFDFLKQEYPEIHQSLYNLLSTIKKGKRYSEFLKLPILFVHTIDKLIQYNAEQILIDKTRELYSKITDYYDTLFSFVVPKQLSLSKGKEPFSFKELFNITESTFDLNTDLESLPLKIFSNFPKLEKAIDFIGDCLILLEKLPFLTSQDFSKKLFSTIFNFEISDDDYFSYKLIWDVFTSKDYTTFKQNLLEIYKTHYPDLKTFNYDINKLIPPVLGELFVNKSISNEIIKFAYDYCFNNINATMQEISFINTNINFGYNLSKKQIDFIKDFYNKNKSQITIREISLMKLILANDKNKDINCFWSTNVNDYANFNDFIMNLFLDQFKNNTDKNSNNLEEFKNITTNLFQSTLTNIRSLSGIFDRFPLLHSKDSYIQQYYNDNVNKSKNYFSQNADLINKYCQIVAESYKSWMDWVDAGIEFASSLVDILEKVDDLIQLATKSLSLISSMFPFISIALDIIMNFYKIEFSSYVFEGEGYKYIWNGGMDESFFFGLIPGKHRSAEDMKLLNPIEVVSPNNKNSYYYNGKTYETEDTLKYVQLNDILNGKYEPTLNLEKVYSILDLINNTNTSEQFIGTSINNLKEKIINYIKNIGINNNVQEIKNSPILDIDSYKYGSNVILNSNITLKENITEILNDIKPTLIAQTPILNNSSKYKNTPIFSNNGNEVDNSIKTYKLPYNSWINGNIVTNDDKNFVIFDPNVKDKQISQEQAKNILMKNFYDSFEVQSKTIDSQFLNSASCYSDLSQTINSGILYTAKDWRNEQKFFFNKADALRWLFKQFKFTAHYKVEKFETIEFNKMIFNSYDEFLNWVDNNTKEI